MTEWNTNWGFTGNRRIISLCLYSILGQDGFTKSVFWQFHLYPAARGVWQERWVTEISNVGQSLWNYGTNKDTYSRSQLMLIYEQELNIYLHYISHWQYHHYQRRHVGKSTGWCLCGVWELESLRDVWKLPLEWAAPLSSHAQVWR